MKIPLDMIPGTVHKTNQYGDIEIVDYLNALNVTVRFLSTGFEVVAQSSNIRKGRVKDKLFPIVFGVGFIGDGPYASEVDKKRTNAFTSWHNMMKRCYYKNRSAKDKWYVDCCVCEEWHNFQNFADWHGKNYIKGYHLDKDIKIKGNKTYSPETCSYVSPKENAVEALSKRYLLRSPDGVVTEIFNMRQFCIDNGLSDGAMISVFNGKRNHHKGWTRV